MENHYDYSEFFMIEGLTKKQRKKYGKILQGMTPCDVLALPEEQSILPNDFLMNLKEHLSIVSPNSSNRAVLIITIQISRRTPKILLMVSVMHQY